jgi:hypothetical protein
MTITPTIRVQGKGFKARAEDAEQQYWLAYAQAQIDYVGPCPWNPFPRTSPWGRGIDESYRRQQIARRRRHTSHAINPLEAAGYNIVKAGI